MSNYQDLLNIKIKKYPLLIVTTIIIFLIILVLNLKIYSVYETKLFYINKQTFINVFINDIDKINESEYMMINNHKHNFEIVNISELLIDELNFINYQRYQIKIDMNFLENEIKQVKVYYQKERIIEKIIKKII